MNSSGDDAYEKETVRAACLRRHDSLHADGVRKRQAQPGAKPIKIGLLYSLSGVTSVSEKQLYDGTKLAIDQINQNGGINGRKIETVFADYASDPAKAADKARKLILDDKVTAIIGTCSSSARKAVKPVVEQYKSLLHLPAVLRRAGGVEKHRLCRLHPEPAGGNFCELAAEKHGEEILPHRLRLCLPAGGKQAREGISCKGRRHGRRGGICSLRQHRFFFRPQQDQDFEAGCYLQRTDRRQQRRVL